MFLIQEYIYIFPFVLAVYVEASDSCNNLVFVLGSSSAARFWSIKVKYGIYY